MAKARARKLDTQMPLKAAASSGDRRPAPVEVGRQPEGSARRHGRATRDHQASAPGAAGKSGKPSRTRTRSRWPWPRFSSGSAIPSSSGLSASSTSPSRASKTCPKTSARDRDRCNQSSLYLSAVLRGDHLRSRRASHVSEVRSDFGILEKIGMAEFCPKCGAPLEVTPEPDRLCDRCGWFGDSGPNPTPRHLYSSAWRTVSGGHDRCRDVGQELIVQQAMEKGLVSWSDMQKIRRPSHRRGTPSCPCSMQPEFSLTSPENPNHLYCPRCQAVLAQPVHDSPIFDCFRCGWVGHAKDRAQDWLPKTPCATTSPSTSRPRGST